jgi:hypothetical protein
MQNMDYRWPNPRIDRREVVLLVRHRIRPRRVEAIRDRSGHMPPDVQRSDRPSRTSTPAAPRRLRKG